MPSVLHETIDGTDCTGPLAFGVEVDATKKGFWCRTTPLTRTRAVHHVSCGSPAAIVYEPGAVNRNHRPVSVRCCTSDDFTTPFESTTCTVTASPVRFCPQARSVTVSPGEKRRS